MAVVQLRHDTPGRAYFRRKLGKAPMEAMRCLKRRLSNMVYQRMLADAKKADPGGQMGRHWHPARPAQPRQPTLRISHFPDPTTTLRHRTHPR